MSVEFCTSYYYNTHLQCLLQFIPQLIGDLVQIVQDYCVVRTVVGMRVDSMDTLDMWLEAEILSTDLDERAYIHYIGYSTSYAKWIHLQSDRHRLALVHTFSPWDEASCLLRPELRLSAPSDENKARRIARFVARGWHEKNVVNVYAHLGWYTAPNIILTYLL